MKIIILVFACLTLVGAQENPAPRSGECIVGANERGHLFGPCPVSQDYTTNKAFLALAERVRALETKIADLEKQLKAANELADLLKSNPLIAPRAGFAYTTTLWPYPTSTLPVYYWVGDGDVDYGRWLREHPELERMNQLWRLK